MKRGLILGVFLAACMFGANPAIRWLNVWNYGENEKIHGIGLDPDGYICYTGESEEDFIRLVTGKVTNNGDTLWRSIYSEDYDAIGYGLVVLPNHHIAVVGTQALTGEPLSFSLRYASDGTLIKTVGTLGRSVDGPPVVAARHEDSCYVGAWGENSLGNATRTSYYLLNSSWDVVLSYGFNSGNTLAGMVINSYGSIYVVSLPCHLGMMTYDLEGQGYSDYEGNPGEVFNASGLAISEDDEIFCGGWVYDTPEQEDFFLLKWDTQGNPIWGQGNHKRYDMGTEEYCLDVTLDDIADCYLAGHQASGEDENVALVKTDSAGNMLWSWIYEMEGNQQIEGIEVDEDGYVYLAGSHHNGVDWDMLVMQVRQPLIITGRVTDSVGSSMEGITVVLSGDTTVEVYTDTGGYYGIEVYNGGTYTVSPDLPGWAFTPPSHTYSPLAHREFDQDFSGEWTGMQEKPTPSSVRLECNSSEIRFSLPQTASVRLAVYDAAGREVILLAEGNYPAGNHRLKMPKLVAGIYFVRLEAGTSTLTRKVLVFN